jgi:hypothetical protein
VILTGLPIVYLVQVSTALVVLVTVAAFHSSTTVSDGPGRFLGSFLNTAFLALHIGVPAIIWHRWVHQTKSGSSANSFSDETTQTDVNSNKVTLDHSQTKGAA